MYWTHVMNLDIVFLRIAATITKPNLNNVNYVA